MNAFDCPHCGAPIIKVIVGERMFYCEQCALTYPLGPEYLLKSKQWDVLKVVLTDINYVESEIASGRIDTLIRIYSAVLAAPQLPNAICKALSEFRRFLRSHRHVLVAWPTMTIQQAANEPAQTEPAIAAERLLACDNPVRPWLKWINRPDENDCLLTLVGHNESVEKGAFSPDSSRILSASQSEVRLWDAETGTELACFTKYQAGRKVTEFSPDGQTIIVGFEDGTLKLFESDQGTELLTATGHKGPIKICAFSPDGNHIISVGSDGKLNLWDAATLTFQACLSDSARDYSTYKFSADGTKLAFPGAKSKNLSVCDLAAGLEIFLPSNGDSIGGYSYVFSPDSRRIVQRSDEKTLKLWDIEINREVATFIGHSDKTYIGGFSPDGTLLLSFSNDRTFRLWDVETSLEIACTSLGSMLGKTAFSPDGSHIIAQTADSAFSCFDTFTGELIAQLRHAKMVDNFACSPDSKLIATWSYDRLIKLWDTESGMLLLTLSGLTTKPNDVSFSPDGAYILSASSDAKLRVWQSMTSLGERGYVDKEELNTSPFRKTANKSSNPPSISKQIIKPVQHQEKRFRHASKVLACAFSPNQTLLATGTENDAYDGADDTLILWNSATGEMVRGLSLHDVCSCEFSPSGESLISGGGDSEFAQLILFEAESTAALGRFAGLNGNIKGCTFSPDGARVLAYSSDGMACLWNAQTFKPVGAHADQKVRVVDCKYSPDGTQIALAVGKTLQIWSGSSGKVGASLSGHDEPITACAFSPDGRKLLSVSKDTLIVWDAKRLIALASLQGQAEALFSADGKKIICRSVDERVCVYDASLMNEITPPYLPFKVWQLVASPMGQRLLCATPENKLKVWDFETGSEVCEFYIGARISAMTWAPDGTAIAAGDETGAVCLLSLMNVRVDPPIANVWCSLVTDDGYAFGCPLCRKWSHLSAQAERSRQACPVCQRQITLSPFTIFGEWNKVAAAWDSDPPRERAVNVLTKVPEFFSRLCILCNRSALSCDGPIVKLDESRLLGVSCLVRLIESPPDYQYPAGTCSEPCTVCMNIPIDGATKTPSGPICWSCAWLCFKAAADNSSSVMEDIPARIEALSPDAPFWKRMLVVNNFASTVKSISKSQQAAILTPILLSRLVEQLGYDRGFPLDNKIRNLALETCLQMQEQILPYMLESAKPEVPLLYTNIMLAAGFIAPDDDRVRLLIEQAARHADPLVRCRVPQVIWSNGGVWAQELIESLATDSDSSVRQQIIGSLESLGKLLHSNGDEGAAEACFKRALTILESIVGVDSPVTATWLNAIVRWLQDNKDDTAAVPLCIKALEIREHTLPPDHPDIAASLNNLGLSQLALNQIKEAEHSLLRAVGINPDSPYPHYWLARLYQQRGQADDNQRETAQWKLYLSLGPTTDTRAWEAMARLAELLN